MAWSRPHRPAVRRRVAAARPGPSSTTASGPASRSAAWAAAASAARSAATSRAGTSRSDATRFAPGGRRRVLACSSAVRTGSEAHVLSTLRPGGELPAWGFDLPVGAGTYHALFPRAWQAFEPAGARRRPAHRRAAVAGHRPRLRAERAPGRLVRVADRERERHAANRRAAVLVGQPARRAAHGVAGRGAAPGGRARRRWRGHRVPRRRHAARPGCGGRSRSPRRRTTGSSWGTRAVRCPVSTATLWADFAADGRLTGGDDAVDRRPALAGESIGGAVSATVTLEPGETRTVRFAIAWDLPVTEFGGGRRWWKRLHAGVGPDGRPGAATSRATRWRRRRPGGPRSRRGRRPILDDPDAPRLVPGGAVQRALLPRRRRDVLGGRRGRRARARPRRPGPLRAPRVPRLPVLRHGRRRLLRVVRDASSSSRSSSGAGSATCSRRSPGRTRRPSTIEASGLPGTRKVGVRRAARRRRPGRGPVRPPQPLPVPGRQRLEGPRAEARAPGVARRRAARTTTRSSRRPGRSSRRRSAGSRSRTRDGDGLPDHAGLPDQTYDTWPMHGPSAYGGLLWLAALRAAEELARRDGDETAARLVGRGLPAGPRRVRAQAVARGHGRLLRLRRRRRGRAPTASWPTMLAGQWYADAVGPRRPGRPDPRRRGRCARSTPGTSSTSATGCWARSTACTPTARSTPRASSSQEVWVGTSYAPRGVHARARARGRGAGRRPAAPSHVT